MACLFGSLGDHPYPYQASILLVVTDQAQSAVRWQTGDWVKTPPHLPTLATPRRSLVGLFIMVALGRWTPCPSPMHGLSFFSLQPPWHPLKDRFPDVIPLSPHSVFARLATNVMAVPLQPARTGLRSFLAATPKISQIRPPLSCYSPILGARYTHKRALLHI